MFRSPTMTVAIQIFWVWVVFTVVVVMGYFLFQWWRRRHPLPPPPPELSYSERLRERLGARKRSGRAAHRKGAANR